MPSLPSVAATTGRVVSGSVDDELDAVAVPVWRSCLPSLRAAAPAAGGCACLPWCRREIATCPAEPSVAEVSGSVGLGRRYSLNAHVTNLERSHNRHSPVTRVTGNVAQFAQQSTGASHRGQPRRRLVHPLVGRGQRHADVASRRQAVEGPRALRGCRGQPEPRRSASSRHLVPRLPGATHRYRPACDPSTSSPARLERRQEHVADGAGRPPAAPRRARRPSAPRSSPPGPAPGTIMPRCLRVVSRSRDQRRVSRDERSPVARKVRLLGQRVRGEQAFVRPPAHSRVEDARHAVELAYGSSHASSA